MFVMVRLMGWLKKARLNYMQVPVELWAVISCIERQNQINFEEPWLL